MIAFEQFERHVSLDELQAARPFWYLATPYSKYPNGLDLAFSAACRAAAMLVRDQIRVFSPIAHSHPIADHGGIDPLDHKIWLPADEGFMQSAYGMIIVKMLSWQESLGIAEEVDAFSAAGKPILYMEWPQ